MLLESGGRSCRGGSAHGGKYAYLVYRRWPPRDEEKRYSRGLNFLLAVLPFFNGPRPLQ